MRVVLDEIGERLKFLRGIIAANGEIRSKITAKYQLGCTSVVVAGTGLDDPLDPPGW